LVGPNGSGKSNFLDALHFITDALRTSLEHAIRKRGGVNEVRHLSANRVSYISMRLEFQLPGVALPGSRLDTHPPVRISFSTGQMTGHYEFRIRVRSAKSYEIESEECVLHWRRPRREEVYYRIRGGEVASSEPLTPRPVSDRLYLVSMSGSWGFRPLFDALSHMGFYNLNPDRMRDPQPPDTGEMLLRDGTNVASVLVRLANEAPEMKTRIDEYLGHVVPGLRSVDRRQVGRQEVLEFLQETSGVKKPLRFSAASMSDGTLRALGILVALFQSADTLGEPVPLVGVEEPEAALHPAAAGILRDILCDAAAHTQVIVTSHSPDLLDDAGISADSILAVSSEEGATQIGPIDEVGRSVLRDRLYTAGDLLRMNQLAPAPAPNDGMCPLAGLETGLRP
jgi:predicted ATPase